MRMASEASSLIPRVEKMTIEGFKESFRRILKLKERCGLQPVLDNPPDLLERAKLYATRYRNGSLGWASNIWHRAEAGTAVIEKDEDLKWEHKLLMRRVLEHVLAQGPLIKVDGILGKPGSRVELRCRLYCDPQFPDIAYRWSQIAFPGDPAKKPDVELLNIPHYLGNPVNPETGHLLMVLRFPNHDFTIVTCSSYQGEVKKGFLSHWILHVYKRGGIGEHAALREFTVKRKDGGEKRVVLCIWGLTGSGKSTHGLYIWDKRNIDVYVERFGMNPLDYVKDQEIKNDDIIAIFEDRVFGSERGSWTKTEDVTERQVAIWKAAMSPRALHEDTEFDERGYPSLAGRLYQYHGMFNKNARSVFFLEDTGYFRGDVESSGPMNMAVFLSPGYFTDYAWVRINDPALAAKVLADGRTVGHPAQSKDAVGVIFSTRYCKPFTMGVSSTKHVLRFYEMLRKRIERGDPVEVYQFNTTGRIIAEYRWVKTRLGDEEIEIPQPVFQREADGSMKPVGGTSPTIEETEFFILQAARGAVEYEPHPVWGEKVLVPVEVEGLPKERLRQLQPTTYLSINEFKRLLNAQIKLSKYHLDRQCPGLPPEIYNAMDF